MTQATQQINANRLAAFQAMNISNVNESRNAYVNVMLASYAKACDDSVRKAITARIIEDGMSYCFAKRGGQLVSKVAA